MVDVTGRSANGKVLAVEAWRRRFLAPGEGVVRDQWLPFSGYCIFCFEGQTVEVGCLSVAKALRKCAGRL
jgi:hypothetical protein